MLSAKGRLFCALIAFSLVPAIARAESPASEGSTSKFDRVNGGDFSRIYPNAIVEGSARAGGMQPDYILDWDSPVFKELKDSSHLSGLSADEKIARIASYVSQMMPGWPTRDPRYLELIKRYRESGRRIPISEYVKTRVGVCREKALITHLALREAGFDAEYVYASMSAKGLPGKVEDHAMNVVTWNGERVIVDSYDLAFSGRKLSDVMRA